VAEGGLPGYEAYAWIGMVMPAGTPKDIVTRLNREIASILAIPDLKARFNNDGAEIVAASPEAFGAHINSELAKWSRVIKEAGIKPQ
jgi:tripartite-type tricarboxylate transporter receptor subunit TctC